MKEELTSRARAAATSRRANGTSDEDDDAEGMLPCIPVHAVYFFMLSYDGKLVRYDFGMVLVSVWYGFV